MRGLSGNIYGVVLAGRMERDRGWAVLESDSGEGLQRVEWRIALGRVQRPMVLPKGMGLCVYARDVVSVRAFPNADVSNAEQEAMAAR